MGRLTKKSIDTLTGYMLKMPKEAGVLYETGELGIEKGGRYYRLTPELVHNGGDEPKEIWRGHVVDLVSTINPKLKYKTHLSNYLYQTLNSIYVEKGKREAPKQTGNRRIDEILASEKYQNYLKNKKLEMDTQVINEEMIYISTGSTSFAHHTLKPTFSKKYLLGLWETAREVATGDSRAHVSKPYKYKKTIENLYDGYEEAVRLYKEDFEQLGKLWEWKLSTDGIHAGYGQDDVYNKVIIPIEFAIQKMGYNGGIIKQFERMEFDLKETIKKSQDEYIISYPVNL